MIAKTPIRVALLLSAAALYARAESPAWQSVAEGLTYARFSFQNEDGSPSNVTVARVDTNRLAVHVIDVKRSLDSVRDQSVYSLQEIIDEFSPTLVINGGFNQSSSFPLATGLVITEGHRYSPLNTTTPYQDGVLCIDSHGLGKIVDRSGLDLARCSEALQSGPLFVSNGSVFGDLSAAAWKSKIRRSAVATTAGSELVFLTTSECSLAALAGFLSTELRSAGLSLSRALNLGGERASGLYIRSGGGPPITTGNRTTVLSTAVSATPKSNRHH